MRREKENVSTNTWQHGNLAIMLFSSSFLGININKGELLMIVTANRGALDSNLNDTTSTIFILVGATNSKAGAVHDLMVTKNWDAYHNFYIFPETTLLASDELSTWFDGNTSQYYVVLGGANLPKKIAQKGPVTDLLKNNGTPNFLAIRAIFLKGDIV